MRTVSCVKLQYIFDIIRINTILTYCLCLVALSLQNGTTVAGYANCTAGSTNGALNMPWAVVFDLGGSMFISEYGNNRVIKLQEGSLMGSIVAGTGMPGTAANQLNSPTGLFVDESSNIYVGDDYNSRVMLWRNNSSTGVIVAGNGTYSYSPSTFALTAGLAIDSHKTLYVSDQHNHRVMKWTQNATYGILTAGTGVAGNGSQGLDSPYGVYFDELNSYLYIADTHNHRIQRYHFGVTTNVTTVAGGNGEGLGNHQLSMPYGVFVSKKTGDIYIADGGNHRIHVLFNNNSSLLEGCQMFLIKLW